MSSVSNVEAYAPFCISCNCPNKLEGFPPIPFILYLPTSKPSSGPTGLSKGLKS